MKETALDQVMKVVGVAAVDLLLAELGGARIVVPKTVGPNHPLAVAMGLDAAQKLAKALPTLTIDLPVTPKKRALIEKALADKVPAVQVARTYYCSVRFVRYVKADMVAAGESPQLGLF